MEKYPEFFKNLDYEFDEEQVTFIKEGYTKINFNSVGVFIEGFHQKYSIVNEIITQFLSAEQKDEVKELRKIIYHQSMLKRCYEFVYLSMFNPENDIYFLQEDSLEWQTFLGRYFYYDPFPDKRRVVKSYCKF